jgi:hypothetical protein
VGTTPSSGPGGDGSGLPSQWSVGAGGNVIAANDDGNTITLQVEGTADQNSDFFRVRSLAGFAGLRVLADGDGHIGGVEIRGNDSGVVGAGSFVVVTGTQEIGPLSLTATQFRVVAVNVAPADGDLAAGDYALWLDATPGATKLMVKAKDSGGTVRSAAIALS